MKQNSRGAAGDKTQRQHGNAPPNVAAGSAPDQAGKGGANYFYPTGLPYVQPVYYQQQYVVPGGQQQGSQTNAPANGQSQAFMPPGQFPRGPMPMGTYPGAGVYVPPYTGYQANPYAPKQQVQRRERKILEIVNPHTKEVITPSPVKPGPKSKEKKPDPVEAVEEKQKPQPPAAPKNDARAEMLAAAKAAVEKDKLKEKSSQAVSSPKQVVQQKDAAPASKPVPLKPAVPVVPASKPIVSPPATVAQESKSAPVATQAATSPPKPVVVPVESGSVKAAIKKIETADNSKPKQPTPVESKQEIKPKRPSGGSAFGKRKDTRSNEVVDIRTEPSQNGKVTYSIETLLSFKASCQEKPEALNNIDMSTLVGRPQPSGRGAFANPREARLARQAHHHHGHHGHKGHAGGQWARNSSLPNNQGNRGGQGQRVIPRQASGLKVEALKVSENAWKPVQPKSSSEEYLREVTQILNKLSRDKFKRLSEALLAVKMSSFDMLEKLVELIRNKALTEPKFGDLYADLCLTIVEKTKEAGYKAWGFIELIEEEGSWFWTTSKDEKAEDYKRGPFASQEQCKKNANKSSELRRILLNQCQEEFEKENDYEVLEDERKQKKKELAAEKEESKKISIEQEITELNYKMHKVKSRLLGNISFIGELFKKGILLDKVLMYCVSHLIAEVEEGKPLDAENLECLCKLLTTVGAALSKKANESTKDFVDNLFMLLESQATNKKLDARHRFMVKDVLEMRKNGWQARREEVKAKTLDEIRKDAEAEERAAAQQSKQHAMNSRVGGYNRGPPKNNRNSGQVMGGVVHTTKMGSGGFQVGGSGRGRDRKGAASQGSAPTARRPMAAPSGGNRSMFRPGGHQSSNFNRSLRPGQGGSKTLSSGSRPAAPNTTSVKIAKKPTLTDEKMKKRIVNSLEELVATKNEPEFTACIKEIHVGVVDRKKVANCLLVNCLNGVMEKSDAFRTFAPKALKSAYDAEILNPRDFKAPMDDVMEFLPDMQIDVPKVTLYMSQFFVDIALASIIPLTLVPSLLEKLLSADEKMHGKVLGLILQGLAAAPAGVTLFKESGLKMDDLLTKEQSSELNLAPLL